MSVLFSHGTNKYVLVPVSCRATVKKKLQRYKYRCDRGHN